MALKQPVPDPLQRAVEELRREPFESTPQRWVELSDSVMTRVRGLVRPGEPLLVFPLTVDPAGSRTTLASRVLLDALRRALTAHPTHAPERIDLRVLDQRLVGVSLALVAAYGEPLLPLADRVRTEVLAVVRGLLGEDPELTAADVEVEFTDVVDGDPRDL